MKADPAAVVESPSAGRPRDPRIDAAILEATAELLVDIGYANLTMAAVADRAGTTKTALYRRWSSKAELVHEAAFPTAPTALAMPEGDIVADVRAMVAAARDEVERSAALPAEGTKERAALALNRIEARAARAMTRGTGLVATIGSTAPFVGLFGTVWGIMNSFVGISRAHTSSLAVVAPGIAEALLATAIGLVAAIPAVVIYNGLARATAGYKAILADASAEVMRHLSRDLDRAARRPARAAE